MASRPTSAKSQRYPTNKRTGKKPLPEPTHIGHFLSILIIWGCKRVILIDTAVKIGLYLIGVLVGSVLSDLFAFPKSYFSNKKNILNRIFVSFGFGWTFVLLSVFIVLTSLVYTSGNWKTVLQKHLSRLFIAALWWYTLTKTFSYVDSVVGVCSLSHITRKYDCVKAGKAWLGFDISGHVFLLIHNLLTISEEVKCFKFWTTLDTLLKEDDLALRRNVTQPEIEQSKELYGKLTPYIKVSIVCLTIWTVFCEFMLITSVVYRFHTLTQKVAAAFVAVGCWFVTYRIFYETDMSMLPTQPGRSSLNFMKEIAKQA